MTRLLVVADVAPADLSSLGSTEACDLAAYGQPAESTWQVQVRGERRQFIVRRPPQAAPGRKYPVVLFFHGAGGRAADMTSVGLYRGAFRNEAVFVAPTGHTVAGGFGWDEACTGPDMEFVDRILDALPRIACVDATKVVASGFSWGGDFVNDLGCCRARRLSGLVSFSGGEMGNDGGFAVDLGVCGDRTPPYLQVYGEKDTAYPQAYFDGVLQNIATLNGCSANPVSVQGCRSFEGCRAPVMACRVPNMAHAVDAAATRIAERFLKSTLGWPEPKGR